MAGRLSFDTTFLIDFQRERAGGAGGPAYRFAEENADAEFLLSAVALGEFAAGFADESSPVLTEVRRRFCLVVIDEAVALHYRKVYRALHATGRPIGANDLWIAAAALATDTPLVSRNAQEFARVPDLRAVGY